MYLSRDDAVRGAVITVDIEMPGIVWCSDYLSQLELRSRVPMEQ